MRVDFSSGHNEDYTYWHDDVRRIIFKESGLRDDNDKFLLLILYTYDQNEGCTLDNQTLASWTGLSDKQIERKLKFLEKEGHIIIHPGTVYIPRIIRVGEELGKFKYLITG